MNLYNVESITINNKKISDIDTNGDNDNQTLATLKTLTDYSKYKGLYYIKDNYLHINTGDDDTDYCVKFTNRYILNFSTSIGATTVKHLTLPGLTSAVYIIDELDDCVKMSRLKSITVLSGASIRLFVHLSQAPSLRYFNLMEGLTHFSLYGTKSRESFSDSGQFIKLVLPASLTTCQLQNLYLSELIFQHNDVTLSDLNLRLSNVWIQEKLECMREVDGLTSSMSVIDIECSSLNKPPPLLICSFGFLKNLNSNNDLGNFNNKTITNTTTLILRDKIPNTYSNSDIPTKLKFYKIINETPILNSNLTNLSSEVPICETEIENLTTRMDTAEENITALKNKTLYEGLFAPVYNGATALINYNYNKGYIKYWKQNDVWMAAINDSKSSGIQINDDIEDIIIPNNVKRLNEDGTVAEYVKNINYQINTGNYRKVLNSLKNLTTMPDVYSLDINLSKAPSLRYFNLMEGLQKFSLIGDYNTDYVDPDFEPESSDPELAKYEIANHNADIIYHRALYTRYKINLTLPSSLTYCKIEKCILNDVIFEGRSLYSFDKEWSELSSEIKSKLSSHGITQDNYKYDANSSLQLILNNNIYLGKFTCMRSLKNGSTISRTASSYLTSAPPQMEISMAVLILLRKDTFCNPNAPASALQFGFTWDLTLYDNPINCNYVVDYSGLSEIGGKKGIPEDDQCTVEVLRNKTTFIINKEFLSRFIKFTYIIPDE